MNIRVFAACLALGIIGAGCTSTPKISTTKLPDEVRAQQIKEMKWGMFICWSFSTFSGEEWTRTITDPNYFRVTGCDTDQWCKTAKEAGMEYILFLTKHHDGFCLWDTKTTDFKVTNTKLGVDVLAELKKSCEKYDLKLALYFSEGDWSWIKEPIPKEVQQEYERRNIGREDFKAWRRNPYWKTGNNPELKKQQLKELCTEYGPIEFWWMDHAQGTAGLDHKATVDWVHQFQPNAFVGFNSGEPAGRLRLRERGKPGKLGDLAATGYEKKMEGHKDYIVAEFTYPILPEHQGGAVWFYSLPEHDNLCYPPEKLYKDYLGAVKYGNIFSIDVGPNYEGRLRDIDVKTLRQVGKMIEAESITQAVNASDKN